MPILPLSLFEDVASSISRWQEWAETAGGSKESRSMIEEKLVVWR